MNNTNINLCDKCTRKNDFPKCLPGDVEFGNGIGNDNIISCSNHYAASADKHSPLPWGKHTCFNSIIDKDEKSILVARKIEDLDFIIEACNNYESLQTNYTNLLQQYEGQADVIAAKDDTIEELQKQLDAVKEIFPDLLNLIYTDSSNGAKEGIDKIFNDYTVVDLELLNELIKSLYQGQYNSL